MLFHILMPAKKSPVKRPAAAVNTASKTAAPILPQRPGNDECCHSGCEPCIFDLYEMEMERYRAALKEWEAK